MELSPAEAQDSPKPAAPALNEALEIPDVKPDVTASMDEPLNAEEAIPTLQDFETLLSSYPATSSTLISLFTLLLSTINTLRNDNIIYSQKIQLYNFLGTATGQVLTDAILERLNALEAENQRLYMRVKHAEAEVVRRDIVGNEAELALRDAHTVISQQEDELDRLTATLKEAASASILTNGHTMHASRTSETIVEDLPRAASPSASTAATSTSRHSGHKRWREDSRDRASGHRRDREGSRRSGHRDEERHSSHNASRRHSEKSSSRTSVDEGRRRERIDKHRDNERRARSRSRSPHRRRRTNEEDEGDAGHKRGQRSQSRERRKDSTSISRSVEQASSRTKYHEDDDEQQQQPQDADDLDPPTVRSTENIPTGPRAHTTISQQHSRKPSNGSRNPNMLGRLGLPLANGANGSSSAGGSSKGGQKGMSILGRGNKS